MYATIGLCVRLLMPAPFLFHLQSPVSAEGGQRGKNKGPGVLLLVDSADIYLVCERAEKNTDSTLLCSGAKNIFFFNLKESSPPVSWMRC